MKIKFYFIILIGLSCYSQNRNSFLSFIASVEHTFISDASLLSFPEISGNLREENFPNTYSKSLSIGFKADLNEHVFANLLFGLENFDKPNVNTAPVRFQIGYNLPWFQNRISPFGEYNFKTYLGKGTQSGNGFRLGINGVLFKFGQGNKLSISFFYAGNRVSYGKLENPNELYKLDFNGLGIGLGLVF